MLAPKLLLELLIVAAVAGCGEGKLKVIDPAVSPDGRAVAFVGYRGRSTLGRNSGDLYVLRFGGKPRRITRTRSGQDEPRRPVWSSDGLKLAFSRDSTTELDSVWVVNADGSRLRRVADGLDPTWARGGQLIAFRNNSLDIHAINPDGTGDHEIVHDDDHSYGPAWSPDGSRIAYTNLRGVVVFNLQTKKPLILPSTRGSSAPAWSPDGRQLAYVGEPPDAASGDGVDDIERRDLYVVNADGSGRRRLTDNHIGESSPSWTPDKRIVFARSQRIYVISADGTTVRRVYGESGRLPSWTLFAIALVGLGALVGIAGYTYDTFRKRKPGSPPATT